MSCLKYQDLWPLLQADICGVLQSDEIIGPRAGVLVEPGDQQSVLDVKIAKALGTGSDGKSGVGFLVLPIERAEDEDPANPFGPFKLSIVVQFVENVTVNRGAVGTGIPIRIYAARAAKILKLYTPVGFTSNLVAARPVVSEFTDDSNKSLRVGQVEFTALEADAMPLMRVSRPQIAVAGATLVGAATNPPTYQLTTGSPATVTVTAPGATEIWYTVDGSHPAKSSPTATLYSVPVQVTDAGLFRARAFAPPMIGSDTAAVNFTNQP